MLRKLATTTRFNPVLVALVGLLLAGGFLRFYGQDWDQGNLFHPDERHILMVTEAMSLPWPPQWEELFTPDSPLNPHSFAYGSFVFYSLKLSASAISAVGSIGGPFAGLQGASDFDGLRAVGRSLSALFDLGTVLLTYLLARQLLSRRTSLLASAFVAFSVLNIQLSHFYASDTLLTFFIVATVILSCRQYRQPSMGKSLALGALLALAVTTKFSALPVALAIALAYGLRLFSTSADSSGEGSVRLSLPTAEQARRTLRQVLATAAVFLTVFVVVQPYALIDMSTYLRNLGEQSAMADGSWDVPYTRQYAERTPYLYFLTNMFTWGVGLPLGLAMLSGTVVVAARALRKRLPVEILMLAWVIPYFAITGAFHAQFLRYMLPLTPFLAVFAAAGLAAWCRLLSRRGMGTSLSAMRTDWASWRGRLLRQIGWASVAAVLALTIGYAVAFVNMYSVEHPGVAASRWLYANATPGSVIATEHWEEGMPVGVSTASGTEDAGTSRFTGISLNLYDPDDTQKLGHLVGQLSQADYILLFSQRLYATIPRLPQRYPLSSQYYRLLFSGQLGFELVADFDRYPNIAGVTLEDDTLADAGLPRPAAFDRPSLGWLTMNLGRADESYSVYDHPHVLVFQKQPRFSTDLVRTQLSPFLSQTPPDPADLNLRPAVLNSNDWAAAQQGGTYSEIFPVDGVEQQAPIAVWVALLLALGVINLPLTMTVLARLPDAGFALSRTLSVLLLAWLTWIVVNARWADNSVGTIAIVFGVLAAGNLAVAIRRRKQLAGVIGARWRILLTTEALFWGTFALFLLIRMANPDLWHPYRGGEKPMDMAYLMAAIRTEHFPPYDPWFAGGYLNYYYFGQTIVATLIKLSGVIPTSAYNLAIPTLFALTFVGVFSAAYNLVALRDGKSALRKRHLAVGVGAGVLALVLGNVGGAGQLAKSLMDLSPAPLQTAVPGIGGAVNLATGLWHGLTNPGALTIPSDWYWASTRVIPDTINEFPFFSFLYADLHAHVIALPFTMLALGTVIAGLAHVLSARCRGKPGGQEECGQLPPQRGNGPAKSTGRASSPTSHPEGGWGLLPLAVVVALALGALAPINSWDYPTYLAIPAGAALVVWCRGPRRTARGAVRLVAALAGVAILSVALYWPFYASYKSAYLGLEPVADKSDLGPYLVIHILFLFALVSFLCTLGLSGRGRVTWLRAGLLVLRRWRRLDRVRALFSVFSRASATSALRPWLVCVAVVMVATAIASIGMEVVALLLPLLIAAVAMLWRSRHSPIEAFVIFLLAIGLALGLACEFLAIRGDIGRMNTVFKFYLQVWMLWSIAAAFGIYLVIDRLSRRRLGFIAGAWLLILGLLVGASAVYPIVGTAARVSDRFDTSLASSIDGAAFMTTAVERERGQDLILSSDLAAINWLQANVVGSPVILEGRAPLYSWGSRISIYTGLPTVLGWDWHQKQQRANHTWMVEERERDVEEMYSGLSIDRTSQLLRRYDVRYIIVGELERVYYPERGLRKFDAMIGYELDIVYDFDGVRIFSVRKTT